VVPGGSDAFASNAQKPRPETSIAHAGAIAERLVQGLSDAYPDVLDGVMRTGAEIAAGPDGQVEVTVTGQQIEHMVEEPDARVALAGAISVESEADVDVGLGGLAVDLGGAGHPGSFSRMRASIDRAWSSKPSARASGTADSASSVASAIRTSLKRRMKCSGLSPDANRAAPLVGRM